MECDLFEVIKEAFFKKINLNSEERWEIMKETMIQSLSHVWFEERRKQLTASNFGSICNKLPHTNCNSIVKKILYNNFDSSAMKYGRKHERDALDELAKTNIQVNPCGLFIDKEFPFLAATPDGLIEDEGILEIKCPLSCSNLSPKKGIKSRKITLWTIDRKTKAIQNINKNIYTITKYR